MDKQQVPDYPTDYIPEIEWWDKKIVTGGQFLSRCCVVLNWMLHCRLV